MDKFQETLPTGDTFKGKQCFQSGTTDTPQHTPPVKLICFTCWYEWVPWSGSVRHCPKCQSSRWNTPPMPVFYDSIQGPEGKEVFTGKDQPEGEKS